MRIVNIGLTAASALFALTVAAPALGGPAASLRWSGFYVGIQAGYGAGTTGLHIPGGAGTTTQACDAGSMGIIPLYPAPAGSVFDSPETGNQRYPATIAALLDLAYDNSIDLYVPQQQGAFDFRGQTPYVADDECIVHRAYALGLSGDYFGGRSGTPPFPPLPPEFPTNFVPSDGNGTIITTTTPGAAAVDLALQTGGFLGGVEAGYNYVTDGGLLLGIEADMSVAALTGSQALGAGSVSADINGFGSLRARVGVATDVALFYLTAGGAVSSTTVTYATGSDSNVRFGWTAGGGIEYALSQTLSVKGEYKYFVFGDGAYSINGTTLTGPSSFSTFTVGINFHF